MPGTLKGGLRAKETNYRKHGKDFYKKIGSKGGKAKVPKGFAMFDKEKIREAGRKGGSKGSRSYKRNLVY